MNDSSHLLISYRLSESSSIPPLTLSLPLDTSSFLRAPSACGKSTFFRDLADYAAALETDIAHILNHNLSPAQKRPKNLKLSCIPTLLLLSPNSLDRMPTTLDALWEISKALSGQTSEEQTQCSQCSGDIRTIPVHDWEKEMLRCYHEKLVALCLPCDRDPDSWSPDGKILIENTLYSLEHDDERCKAASSASAESLPCFIYDRLRIGEATLPRIQTAIREACKLEHPGLRIFELNADSPESSWISSLPRCIRCGKIARETTTTLDDSLKLGALLQRTEKNHALRRLLEHACGIGFSELTLNTRLNELSYGKRLLLSLLGCNRSLVLIDGLRSILSVEEEEALNILIKERNHRRRASIFLDSRSKHPDCIDLAFPERHSSRSRSISDIQLPGRKAFVAASESLLLDDPELKRGAHYHITASQEGYTLYDQLLQELQVSKDRHRLSILSHIAKTPVNQRSRSIIEFLGLHKVLQNHLARSIEAKTLGLRASDIAKTPHSTRIQFLGNTYEDFKQMSIKEAASILSSIPNAGPCLSLLDYLIHDDIKLSRTIQSLSSSEYQRLCIVQLLYSRLLPYIVFLEFPAWGMDEACIEKLKHLLIRLTSTDTTIITLDSYPWGPCLRGA